MIRRAINDLLVETTRVPILSEWPASENKIHADRNCPCGLCVVAFARALWNRPSIQRPSVYIFIGFGLMTEKFIWASELIYVAQILHQTDVFSIYSKMDLWYPYKNIFSSASNHRFFFTACDRDKARFYETL